MGLAAPGASLARRAATSNESRASPAGATAAISDGPRLVEAVGDDDFSLFLPSLVLSGV